MTRIQFRRTAVQLSFLLPIALFFTFAMLTPFFMGIEVSFTDWNGLSKTMNYIGFDNYRNIFISPDVLIPLKNTLAYGLMYVVANNLLALGLALALNRTFRGRNASRLIFFIPNALSPVLTAFVWSFIYKDLFRELFNIQSLFSSTGTALLGIVILAVWHNVGISMLIYLASLSGVPKELYEAATVDGAGAWQRFIRVTVPMIVPAFTVCITLSLTSGLREFAFPLVATGGGPVRATETLAIYIYNYLFAYNKAGYGQALAFLFMAFLLIVGLTVSRLLRRKEIEA
ncbi:carbohydrate ABC transporter permease [Cohnella boryungensis]|uniref:Carbohydrate ABC transporter permease n=1 Tax=Cohnella boryungensis TaxID=768479 RepID=A0ABV8S789_9BACL